MTNRPILLVEDNPDDVALTLRALKKNNILNEVTVAPMAPRLSSISSTKTAPAALLTALVLLDLKLPKIDGLEVLRRMRADEQTQIIPVVILTSSRLEEDILAGYRDGANAFVRKPVNFTEFADAINALGMFWLLLNETVPRDGMRMTSMGDGHGRSEPQSGEPQATAGPGQPDAARSAAQPARILILEDEAWDAELAQRLMTSAEIGFTAVVVDTKESFLEQLAAFRPQLILSDFQLPGFSGAAALKLAQEHCPGVPVIIWSGVLGDEAAVELIKQGATDYILKDRPARLPSAIRRALAEAEQRAQLAQFEDQLLRAQHLASLGQLAAAEQAMSRTRQMLAAARGRPPPQNPDPYPERAVAPPSAMFKRHRRDAQSTIDSAHRKGHLRDRIPVGGSSN